ncbi:MAG: TetR/AcrR family transcriptional regulator [Candidatus Neomarinimicrobiota bacterium]|nr:MAG: TetR/AcrR family transcriptional regulator [Candidatus Neomarinimicrobiota bacterium]
MVTQRQLEEREMRRQRILQGALRVYQRDGIEKATMDGIAKEAGFGKATLYYYFESKEEIFVELLRSGWEQIWESVESILEVPGTPRTQFAAILKSLAHRISRDPAFYGFLFQAPTQLTGLPAERQTWRKHQNRMYGVLRGLLEDGIAQEEFPRVDSELLLRAIGGLFHGLFFLGTGGQDITDENMDLFLDNLFSGSSVAMETES